MYRTGEGDLTKLLSIFSHRLGGNRKRSQQSTNADQKLLETVFSIAICRQSAEEKR